MLLVTGGAGFIGSNVVASLNEADRADIAVNDILGSDGKWRNQAGRRNRPRSEYSRPRRKPGESISKTSCWRT